MRNLYTYDMFLLEYKKGSRTQKLSFEQAVDIYLKNCSNWDLDYENKTQIYRGVYSSHELFYVNPKESDERRYSANTHGIYNSVFNVTPSWEKAPNREHSLIMSTSLAVAQTFGEDYAHLMIPFNNTEIGLCSKDDIWASIPYVRSFLEDKWYTLEDLDGEIYDFLRNNIDEKYLMVNKYGLNNEKTRTDLKNIRENIYEMFKEIDKLDRSKLNINYSYSKEHTYKLVEVWLAKFPQLKFLDFLKHMLDFDKNEFKIINSQNELVKNSEVWSSGEFLGIHENHINKFIEMVNESNA